MLGLVKVIVSDDLWVVIPAWLTLILLVVAAGAGLRQVNESRRLREAQARPYVVVDFDLSRPPMIYLVIENMGSSMAEDITFCFEPPIESSIDCDSRDRTTAFTTPGWTSLAPRKRIETFFDSAFIRLSPENKLPLKYTVAVNYKAPVLGGKQFNETYVLDLLPYKNLQYFAKKDFDDLVKAIEAIEKVLTQLSIDPLKQP